MHKLMPGMSPHTFYTLVVLVSKLKTQKQFIPVLKVTSTYASNRSLLECLETANPPGEAAGEAATESTAATVATLLLRLALLHLLADVPDERKQTMSVTKSR